MSATGDRIRRRVLISGRVQGVGFRETCRREAQHLGLVGTVRNRADGSVEAVFEGPAAAVARMIDWCRQGPRSARVQKVTVTSEPPDGDDSFTISFSR